MKRIKLGRRCLTIACVAILAAAAFSQEITYQGFLKQNGAPLNGTYDIRLEVYTAATGGSWVFTSNAVNVPVVNGVFASNFTFANPGNDPRWVEVSVRPSGTTTWTNLLPRQPLTYVPLAINAVTLAGINVDGFIRNSGTQQTATNFNIGGTGTANIFNAATQFNLNGNRILSAPLTTNLFIGQDSGAANTVGDLNTFVGYASGFANTTGNTNTFIGAFSGNSNIDGHSNVFLGVNAGRSNISGIGNAFFGSGTFPLGTGQNNTTGSFNVYFGHRAGETNNGSSNTYLGTAAGRTDQSGDSNTFVGHDAGDSNNGGSFNVVLGDSADVGSANLTNATAIGSKAQVTQSNSLVLGSINGINGATADTKVGIGTTAPSAKLHINDVSNNGLRIVTNAVGGTVASFGSKGSFQIDSAGLPGGRFNVAENGNATIGGSLIVSGDISLSPSLVGADHVCIINFKLAFCGSSARYKSNITPYSSGLDLISRLRPVRFNWKQDGRSDLGLIAEDVAAVDPVLVTYSNGEILGVKYDRIGIVAINAIKEQQAEIESLRRELAELKALLCTTKRTVRGCRKQGVPK